MTPDEILERLDSPFPYGQGIKMKQALSHEIVTYIIYFQFPVILMTEIIFKMSHTKILLFPLSVYLKLQINDMFDYLSDPEPVSL